MKSLFSAVLLSFLMAGCGAHVVRDTNAYTAEINFSNNLITKQAEVISMMIQMHCSCDDDMVWSNQWCANAADVYAVYIDRWDWHFKMQKHLGLGEERPSKTPPAIRSKEEMCVVFKSDEGVE